MGMQVRGSIPRNHPNHPIRANPHTHMTTPGRDTVTYRRHRARIQKETTNCARCGTPLDGVNYKWPHPYSVVAGHIIALEDCPQYGIHPDDPTNLQGECIPCNARDGQRRTSQKLRARRHPQTEYTNPDW